MMRVVRANDDRTWTVRSSIHWTGRSMAEEFEHDVTDYAHGVGILVVLVALTLFVVFWTPADVVIPAWFVLLILLLLLLVPVSWALQRPWIITASTDEPKGKEERWRGVVRGMVLAREEVLQVAEDLKTKGNPDEANQTLERVNITVPFPDS